MSITRCAVAIGLAIGMGIAGSRVVEAQCTGNWGSTGASLPQARLAPGIAFNPVLNKVTLFGGGTYRTGGVDYHRTTHVFNYESYAAWQEISNVGPAARSSLGMVTDTNRGRIVMFGGANNTGMLNDTWVLTGDIWARLAIPGPLPVGRENFAMAYDSHRDRVVLFGGAAAGNTILGDTWEFDGSRWSQRLVAGPGPRYGTAMAYDPIRRRCVLHGGVGAAGTSLGETWEWDGTSWTLASAGNPSIPTLARYAPGLAFDPNLGRIVLFGGVVLTSLGQGYQDSSFSWSGSSWIQLSGGAGVTPRDVVRMAYSPAERGIVMYGGRRADGAAGVLNDTELLRLAIPVVTVPPRPAAACQRGNVSLYTQGYAGGAQLHYQWRRNGENLSDHATAAGTRVIGTTSVLLEIQGLTAAQEGDYECIITGGCGMVTTSSVTVRICRADTNCDGQVTLDDLFMFLTIWFSRGAIADLNGDGHVAVQDLFDYIALYLNGCD